MSGLFNAWQVEQATGVPRARAIVGRGKGWGWGEVECWEGSRSWDALVAATGRDRWVRCVGLEGWFPVEIVEKAKALGLADRKGKPLRWVEGRPCDEVVLGHGIGGGHRCERVAVGTIETRGIDGTMWVCSLHLRAFEKRRANDEAMRARFAEDSARRTRARDHQALATEFLEWAGDLLAELGIHPATITVGTVGERTGILLPTEAVATLLQEATGERYPGRPETATQGEHHEHT